MWQKRHTQRERLFISGAVLLVLLVAGVFVTGRIINRRAGQMSDRVVTQISESHCLLLQAEFNRTEEVLAASARFLHRQAEASEAELRVLTATLLEVDPKAGSIWFSDPRLTEIHRYTRNGGPVVTVPSPAERMQRTVPPCDSVRSGIRHEHGIPVWMLVCTTADAAGRLHTCGIDYPLPALYTHITEQNPHSRSSATLLDPAGRIVYHPDSLRLGSKITDKREIEAFREVLGTGRSIIVDIFSDYLGVDEQRIYYPIRLAGQRWVAGIGIPRLVIEQEIDEFHFYTILTAVISVLFFAALLIVAQRRWQREYALRRLSEQESAQLQLQQVIDQIDPHFLFNSLNSLYALIRCNPEQAREFTITLSRVYRRVLERRKQILSTLSEELEFTEQYHALQKIRFGGCLELSITVDPALLKRRIPSMSLQTLVENAVKHNSISARNPLRIRIRTEEEAILIENNFTPRSNENPESLGVGLERIRSIYRFYTDENISISTREGVFRCRLPLLHAEE